MNFDKIWNIVERFILRKSRCILIVDYDFFILNENNLKFIQKQKKRLRCSRDIEIVIPKSTLLRLKESMEHNEIPYTYKAKRAYTQIKLALLKKKSRDSIPVKIDMENSFDYSQAGKYFIRHPKRYEIETYSVAKSYYQKHKKDVFILTTNRILEHLCKKDSKIVCINPFLKLLEKPFKYGFTLDVTIFLDYPHILDELTQSSSTYIFIHQKVIKELRGISNIEKGLNSYIKDIRRFIEEMDKDEDIKEKIDTIICELEKPEFQRKDNIDRIKSYLNRVDNFLRKVLKANGSNEILIKLKKSINIKRKRLLKAQNAILAKENIYRHIEIYTNLLKSKDTVPYFLAISSRYNRFSENIVSKNESLILTETLELRDIADKVFLLSNNMRLCVEASSVGIFPISSRDIKIFELLRDMDI